MLSGATDLPEELFHDIILDLANVLAPNQELAGFVVRPIQNRDLKRFVSRCGQVCRYWARLCRPFLFHWITLRNPEDANTLASFLNCDHPEWLPSLSQCLHKVSVEPRYEDPPWLHLVPVFVLSHLPKRSRTRDVYTVDASFLRPQDNSRPLHSIHSGVPRTLPRAYSPVQNLILSDVKLATGRELLSLLSSLRILCYVLLRNLSWDTPPDMHTFATAAIKLSDTVQRIEVSGEDCASLVFLLWPALIPTMSQMVLMKLDRIRRKDTSATDINPTARAAFSPAFCLAYRGVLCAASFLLLCLRQTSRIVLDSPEFAYRR